MIKRRLSVRADITSLGTAACILLGVSAAAGLSACSSAEVLSEGNPPVGNDASADVDRGPFDSVRFTYRQVDLCNASLNGCLLSVTVTKSEYVIEDNNGSPVVSPVTAGEWADYKEILSSKQFAEEIVTPETVDGYDDPPAAGWNGMPALWVTDSLGMLGRNVDCPATETSTVCALKDTLVAGFAAHLTCPVSEGLNGFDLSRDQLPVRWACFQCSECPQEPVP